MKPYFNLPGFIVLLLLFQSCNTLYSIRVIDIEVVEPARILFPSDYKNVAVKYNNSNVSYNPNFAEYYEDLKVKIDSTNLDSIASMIYYESFLNILNQQNLFDSIIELPLQNYSNVLFIDSMININKIESDTLEPINQDITKIAFQNYSKLVNNQANPTKTKTKIIDQEFGLYSKEELKKIADSTNADLLLSLDFFATTDGGFYIKEEFKGYKIVIVPVLWNFYDLKKIKLEYFYDHIDTITWNESGSFISQIKKSLPPRYDAILNAAEISGNKFADFLIPHWIEVQRMYYHSGQIEMKKTDQLIKDGKWLDAAEIWKANINNPNKNIIAKSMFNLGLACEMEGNLDSAIEWAVMSYHIFGQKNEVHASNCMDYIRILYQRKLDIKKIELQMNQAISPSLPINKNE